MLHQHPNLRTFEMGQCTPIGQEAAVVVLPIFVTLYAGASLLQGFIVALIGVAIIGTKALGVFRRGNQDTFDPSNPPLELIFLEK